MSFDPNEIWASVGVRRVPTQQEYGNGFVGGPADPDIFNYLVNRLQKEDNELWAIVNGLYINSSVTLYVPSDFPTIQGAFDYLQNKIIVSPAFVTIEIESGAPEQVITTPLRLNNPYGHRIRLRGQPLTGSFPTDTDFSGTKANDLAMLRTRFPSRVFCQGTQAMIMVAHQIDRISNILFIGDGATPVDGVVLGVWNNEVGSGQGRFENCWTHNFARVGWRLNYASRATGDNVGASHCGAQGILSTNMSTFQITTGARAFRCAGTGIAAMDQSFLEIDNAASCDNGASGIEVQTGAVMRGSLVRSQRNGGSNFNANGGRLDLVNPSSATPGSGAFDYRADFGGYLAKVGGTGSVSSSPAFNQVGNSNSYVRSV